MSATRDIAKNRNNKRILLEISSKVFSGQVLLAIILIPLTLPFLLIIKIFIQNPSFYFLGLFGGLFQGLNLFWFFRGMERMKYVALVEFFTKLIATVGIFVFVKSATDSWIVLFHNLAATFIAFILGFTYIKKEMPLSIKISKKLFTTFKISSRFFWVRAGAGLSSMGLIFICGIYLPPSQVAFFTGAEKIITTVRSLLTPAVDALFPRLSYLLENDLMKGIELIRKSFYVMLIIGLFLSFFVFLFAQEIVLIFLGIEYLNSVLVLKILSPIPLIASINHTLGSQWMIPIRLDLVFSKIVIFNGIITLFISYLLLEINKSYHEIAALLVISNFSLILYYNFFLKSKKLHFLSKKIHKRLKHYKIT